jgi:ribosomal protein S27AE
VVEMKVCPRCGSDKIVMSDVGLVGITPMNDLCGKCGYKGLFPEVDDVKEFRKRINANRKSK